MRAVTVVPNSGVFPGMLAIFDAEGRLYYVGPQKGAPVPDDGGTVVLHRDEVLDYERSLANAATSRSRRARR